MRTSTFRPKRLFLITLLLTIAIPGALAQRVDSPNVEHLNGAGILPTESPLPFSDAVRVGDMVFLSGMIGVVPGTLELVSGGTAAEARQALENIEVVLQAHGLTRRDVVKCTVMMEDIAEWGAFNAIYASFFTAPYPARSAFGTDGLALGARLEVECVAATPQRHNTLPEPAPSSPVYTILDITVHDDARYQRYREAVAPIIAAHGGRYVVRSGAARFDPDPNAAVISPEGDWHPDRIIVLEFPSRAALEGFVASPEYQAVAPLRAASATTRSVVVNGYADDH